MSKKTLSAEAEKQAKQPKLQYPAVFEGMTPPKELWRSRRIGTHEEVLFNGKKLKGTMHVCGRGSKTAQVMFVSPAAFREEVFTQFASEPHMLAGPAGNLFQRMLYRCGFKEEEWYYTAVCKYNVPKLKPSPADIRWNAAILEDEIRTIKPKLIVCCGKLPFDHLFKTKFKLHEIQGGFFRSEEYDCLLYAMDTLLTPLMKPEYQERAMVDLKEIRKCLDEMNGISVVKIPQQYETIDTAQKLQNWMDDLENGIKSNKLHRLAVDCEWHGQTAWADTGKLRSIQAAWKPGFAAFLRLCAPVKGEVQYVFDKPLPVVREIISPVFNSPKVKFIGHNIHADMAWMDEHLDIDVYNRTEFDTLFAQHTLNEYADLKLERCAVQYTDLGRYDIELLLWKKKNKLASEDGYGLIPDEIVIPYGCRDVDATLRVFPILAKKLMQEKLWTYYNTLILPFVSDGFYELMSTGIPIDRDYLDEMRHTYTHHGGVLQQEFRNAVKREADMFLHAWLRKQAPASGRTPTQATQSFLEMLKLQKDGKPSEARAVFESYAKDTKSFSSGFAIFSHWSEADGFNPSSTDHMRRWLFDVKRFQPLKTTKKDGIQMAWDRVLTLSPEKQAEYTPAADKQSVKVFASKDKLVAQLEELKSVQNITKAFLKEPDEDGTENGLHFWIQSDMRVHANFALTETARPRAWNPNILNWPKAITKPIEKAFERINIITVKSEAHKSGAEVDAKQVEALRVLSDGGAKDKDRKEAMTGLLAAGHGEAAIESFVRLISKPISVRSSARAPEGCALLDMDLKTAEVVGLAELSGDQNLQRVLYEPDTQFARIDKDDPKKAKRICYNDNVNLPEAARDASLLIALDDPRILRDASGQILHPKRDVHWEMAEEVAGKARESLEERLYRDGCGKVGNFCLLHSSRVLTHRGEVAIQEVQLTDLLWDGVEWVSHEGVVCNGTKLTHCYQGLWATDNHEVWIDNGNKVLFGDALRNGWNLLRVAAPDAAAKSGTLDSPTGDARAAAKAGCQDGEAQVGLVYDILNVGPRHRFTCSGVLVSNSIPYGATATLLERMIEANTGIKPPDGTGQKMIDTHANRYPTATDFQLRMERCIEDPGFYRSVSGRVRHFFYTNLGDVHGLQPYTLEGILSPLKRQARNFP